MATELGSTAKKGPLLICQARLTGNPAKGGQRRMAVWAVPRRLLSPYPVLPDPAPPLQGSSPSPSGFGGQLLSLPLGCSLCAGGSLGGRPCPAALSALHGAQLRPVNRSLLWDLPPVRPEACFLALNSEEAGMSMGAGSGLMLQLEKGGGAVGASRFLGPGLRSRLSAPVPLSSAAGLPQGSI